MALVAVVGAFGLVDAAADARSATCVTARNSGHVTAGRPTS